MARKKLSLEDLSSEVKKILSEYGDEVDKNLDEITKRIGKKGAEILKNESLARFPNSKKHKRRYGQTWTYAVEKKRLYTRVVIYNRQSGLPHLLEYGHALVAGGRVAGRVDGKEHIAPVATELSNDYEAEVKQKL